MGNWRDGEELREEAPAPVGVAACSGRHARACVRLSRRRSRSRFRWIRSYRPRSDRHRLHSRSRSTRRHWSPSRSCESVCARDCCWPAVRRSSVSSEEATSGGSSAQHGPRESSWVGSLRPAWRWAPMRQVTTDARSRDARPSRCARASEPSPIGGPRYVLGVHRSEPPVCRATCGTTVARRSVSRATECREPMRRRRRRA